MFLFVQIHTNAETEEMLLPPWERSKIKGYQVHTRTLVSKAGLGWVDLRGPTGRVERDFLQGNVVIGQGGVALS